MRSVSLKLQFVLMIVLISGVTVVGTTAFLYWTVVRELREMDKQILENRLNTIRTIMNAGENIAPLLAHEVNEYVEGLRPIFLRVLFAPDKMWLQTPGMPQEWTADRFPLPSEPHEAKPALALIKTTDGKSVQALSARVSNPAASQPEIYIVQIVIDSRRDYEVLAEYRLAIIPALLLAGLTAAFLGGSSARRIVAPIQRITESASTITTRTLGERLDLKGVPAELRQLVSTYNGMLARLEQSYVGLREFSDNIAHELRTPINNISLSAEYALSRTRSPEEYRETCESQLDECRQLIRLIDDLLFLAGEAGDRAPLNRQWVDVTKELDVVREYFQNSAVERQLSISLVCEPNLHVSVNRVLFQRAVANLVSNALSHTPSGGTVRIEAANLNHVLRVSVVDTGEGIAEEHLHRIFDRFFRVGRQNASTSGRVGLGLSIVKKIIEFHDGTITVRSQIGAGTSVVCDFPANPPDWSPPLNDNSVT